MSAKITNLYNLNYKVGALSWQDCKKINRELAGMSYKDIPEHQVSNVVDYLCSILIMEMPLHCHRQELEQMLVKLQE